MRGADIFTGWVDDETGEVFGQVKNTSLNTYRDKKKQYK